MEMKKLLAEYTAYNLWANRKLGNYLKQQKLELLDQEITSSFPSIRLTLLHNWSVEVGWLNRLKNISTFDFPSDVFTGNTHDLINNLIDQSQIFVNHVNNLPEGDFLKRFEFTVSSGKLYNLTATQIIHHCMNHTTYHRGQVVTMARQLNMVDIPSTDLFFYY